MTAQPLACPACHEPTTSLPLCPACLAKAVSAYAHVSGARPGRYRPELFELLEQLEPRSFWFRSRNRLIIWALHTYCPGLRSFLEVGCGTGFVLAAVRAAFPGVSLMGSELAPEGLEVARRRLPDVPLVQMDALDVPLSAAFGAVGVFDVLEHIESDEAVLRELREAVTGEGVLVVTVPQHRRLWSAADEFAGHVRRYSRNELAAKLDAAGWSPVRMTSFVSLPLPFFIVSRLLRARSRDRYVFEREFTLPRGVDGSLDALMRGELSLIRRGVSFPLGASLLVVAKRGPKP
jgi:SAM-dependent methyltransferase